MIKINEKVFLVNSDTEYETVVTQLYGSGNYGEKPKKYPSIVTPTYSGSDVVPNDAYVYDVYHAITGGGDTVERCVVKDSRVSWEHVKIHELNDGDVWRELDGDPRILRVVQQKRIEGRSEIYTETLAVDSDEFLVNLPPLPAPHERMYNGKITFNRI